MYNNISPTIFGDHIFEMCDVDTSAGLDFAEFVMAAMRYCFFGKLEILKFCFYIFDKDKNGFIEARSLSLSLSLFYHEYIQKHSQTGRRIARPRCDTTQRRSHLEHREHS